MKVCSFFETFAAIFLTYFLSISYLKKMNPKIIITDKLHPKAVELGKEFADLELDYGCSHEGLLEKISEYDALVVRSGTKVTKDIIEKSNLKIIGRAGVGLDNIDLKAAKKKGIKVVNSPEASTYAVTELVFGSALCLLRNVVKGDNSLRKGKWERSQFVGHELYGKILGIVGLGKIGREVAKRGAAFGMKLLAYDPYLSEEQINEVNAKKTELEELLQNADVVTLHLPLTANTENILSAEKLALMKSSAILINIARGKLIDDKALYQALKEEQIKGAALDVFREEPPLNSPLLKLENVVLTPHLGASTFEAQEKAGTVVMEKIKKFFAE